MSTPSSSWARSIPTQANWLKDLSSVPPVSDTWQAMYPSPGSGTAVGGALVGTAGAVVGTTGASVGAAVGVAQPARTREAIITKAKTAYSRLCMFFLLQRMCQSASDHV